MNHFVLPTVRFKSWSAKRLSLLSTLIISLSLIVMLDYIESNELFIPLFFFVQNKEVLYDSLQLAHKCILNSFYG